MDSNGFYYWSWRYDSVVNLDGAVLFNSKQAAMRSAKKSKTEWRAVPVRLTVLDDG